MNLANKRLLHTCHLPVMASGMSVEEGEGHWQMSSPCPSNSATPETIVVVALDKRITSWNTEILGNTAFKPAPVYIIIKTGQIICTSTGLKINARQMMKN